MWQLPFLEICVRDIPIGEKVCGPIAALDHFK
jgi:hypothetical protein